MKVGIFGGTFDPIHNGHLILGEQVREKLGLDKIFFVPNSVPPHKKIFSDKKHRYQMLTIALKNNHSFTISPFEMEREDETYSYKTIEYFKKNIAKNIFFIMGIDSLKNIKTWGKGCKILSMCKFIVINRDKIIKKNIIKNIDNIYLKNLIFIEDISIAISSTMIREKVKKNLSIKYLVPRDIENYIKQNNLYQGA